MIFLIHLIIVREVAKKKPKKFRKIIRIACINQETLIYKLMMKLKLIVYL
jgi:hypothetical protein